MPPTTSRPSKLDLCLGQKDPTWSKALFKGWLARRGGLFTALQGVALCLPFCFPVDRGGFYLAFKNFKKCCLFICLSYLQLCCLQCCAWALSGCGERGLLSVEPGLPTVVASHVAEALGQMGFSSCSSWAQELRVMA